MTSTTKPTLTHWKVPSDLHKVSKRERYRLARRVAKHGAAAATRAVRNALEGTDQMVWDVIHEFKIRDDNAVRYTTGATFLTRAWTTKTSEQSDDFQESWARFLEQQDLFDSVRHYHDSSVASGYFDPEQVEIGKQLATVAQTMGEDSPDSQASGGTVDGSEGSGHQQETGDGDGGDQTEVGSKGETVQDCGKAATCVSV